MSGFADCQTMFAALSAYLDAELDAGAREEFRRHLGGCPECEEFLESLRKTVELCRGPVAGEAPALAPEWRARLWDAWTSRCPPPS